MSEEFKKLREELEEASGKILTFLINCPFCKESPTGVDLCKKCDGKKKLHLVIVSDEYNVFTIYDR